MYDNNTAEVCPDINALVREYLRLDPLALIAMDPKKASVGGGLQELLLRTLERALGSLWAPEGIAFRLQMTASSQALRAAGWPDAATYNMSSLFAHALVGTARRVRSLPYIPLAAADSKVVTLPQKRGVRNRKSTTALVAMATELLEIDLTMPGPGALQPLSICTLIKEMLHISPDCLVRQCYEKMSDAEDAWLHDPDGQASTALAAMFVRALDTYQQVVSRKEADAVRLLIVDEKRDTGPDNARYSNIINLLVAALLVGRKLDVAFIV